MTGFLFTAALVCVHLIHMQPPSNPEETTPGAAAELSRLPASTTKLCRINYAWLIVGLVAIVLAFLADDSAQALLRISDNPALSQFARKASLAGEGWVLAVLGVVLTPILLWARRPAAARMVAIVVLAGLISGAGGTLVRTLTGRTRPTARAAQGFYGVRYEGKWIAGRYQFSSFPSGHASTVAGFAWAVWLLNRRLGLAALLYAAIVSWSRVGQNVHHLSDVVAGTVFGMVAACLVVRFIGPWVDKAMARLERKPTAG